MYKEIWFTEFSGLSIGKDKKRDKYALQFTRNYVISYVHNKHKYDVAQEIQWE